MRLIDADLLKSATVDKNSIWDKITDASGRGLSKIIDGIPTADVQPVVRGEWYLQNYCYIDEFKEEHNTKRCECSVCHERPLYNEFGSIIYSKYCPNCGARMVEE